MNLQQKLSALLKGTSNGGADGLMPPAKLMARGKPSAENFLAEGQHYLQLYQDLCDLQPHERILDVGCGVGRRGAVPLTSYLNETGRYFGFDIDPARIKWCEKNITARYPHFQFRQDKLQHPVYAPKGKYKILDHYFAYEPKDFHFVLLMDVLPYLSPDEMAWYLKETSRVLKKRGRCLIGLYLLNDETMALSGVEKFGHKLAEHRVLNPQQPAAGYAFAETFVFEALATAGLELNTVHYGTWAGRTEGQAEFDLIIADKP